MSKSSRPKKEYSFSLYHDQIEEARLMEYIDYLKKMNQFPKSVQNGLRLLWTLGEGNLSLLFELYPPLRSQFMPKPDELIEQFRQMLQARVTAAVVEPEKPSGPQQLELPLDLMPPEPPHAPAPPPASESIERTIHEAVQAGIQQALSQITKMQSATGMQAANGLPFQKRGDVEKNGNAKPLKTPQLAMPIFDDEEEDEIVVKRDVTAGASTTASFLDAAFGFQERKDG